MSTEGIIETGRRPSPCSGCARWPRCATELRMCSAQSAYMQGAPVERIALLPRVDSSHQIYVSVMALTGGIPPAPRPRTAEQH